jgi:hypothetical protein
MVEINHHAIVESLIELYSDKFSEWESDFLNNMLLQESYSDKMKSKIIELNRKYRCKR